MVFFGRDGAETLIMDLDNFMMKAVEKISLLGGQAKTGNQGP
jgi:hypothetical protein